MVELNFPSALNSEADFYGRAAILEQIEDAILSNNHTPILIIGEQRIGKTSLLHIVLQRLKKTGAPRQFIPLEIASRGLASLDECAQAILVKLADQQGSRPDIEQPLHLAVVEQFESLLASRMPPHTDRVYLLCVDDFDKIVRNASSVELPRILGLVQSLIEKSDLPILLFFTMTSLPEALRQATASTLLAKSHIFSLPLLTQHELHCMALGIVQPPLSWEVEDTNWLYQQSGGHPYYAKLILKYCLPPLAPALSRPPLEEALNEALKYLHTTHAIEDLNRSCYNLAEWEVLLLLAQRQGPLARQELKMGSTRHLTAALRLTKRHYLLEKDGYFDFQIGLFAHLLRSWEQFTEACAESENLFQRFNAPPVIEVHAASHQVFVAGRPIKLTRQEYLVMEMLSKHAGHLVGREALINAVWNTINGVSQQAVDTAMFRLRKKMKEHGHLIEAVPGQGYIMKSSRLVADNQDEPKSAADGGEDDN